MAERYVFARVTADDLPLVRTWLSRDHVAQWWPDGESQMDRIAAHCRGDDTTPYIVSFDGRPFAYLQCSREPEDVRGIDQFIGEHDLLNVGHGSRLIRQFCDALFVGSVTAVTTDPDPTNVRAIRAYEKAGFRSVGPRSMPWGNVLLMRRDNDVTRPNERVSK